MTSTPSSWVNLSDGQEQHHDAGTSADAASSTGPLGVANKFDKRGKRRPRLENLEDGDSSVGLGVGGEPRPHINLTNVSATRAI